MANWLRNLIVNEVSLVDRPANPGAVKVLAKRDEPIAKDMYQVARFADLMSSLAYLMQSAEYEAEIEGDGSGVPAALRAWLKQGASIFTSMAKEEVGELLASAKKKRDDASKALQRKGTNMGKLTELLKSFGRAKGAMAESVKSIVDDDAATDKVAAVDKTLEQFFEHVEDEIEKTLSGDEPGAGNGEDTMSPELKTALGLADTATEADAIAAISKRDADLEVAKADMTDVEKAHHDALKSDDDKKAFRALSHDDRAAKMAKRDDLPEHIKKALADADELKKRLAALEAKDSLVSFQKRAVDIGLTQAQGELLMKAHSGDKDALTKLENAIKGLNEQVATGKVFAEFGTSNGGDALSATSQIDTIAADLMKSDPNLKRASAIAKIAGMPQHREVWNAYKVEAKKPRAA